MAKEVFFLFMDETHIFVDHDPRKTDFGRTISRVEFGTGHQYDIYI